MTPWVRISEQCHSCGVCMDVCPVSALDMTPPFRASVEGGETRKPWMMEFPVLVGKCTGCRLCEVECPFGAIEVVHDASVGESVAREVAAAWRERPAAGGTGAPSAADGFQPLSALTRETRKGHVRSPFPSGAHWKPAMRLPGRWRVWRRLPGTRRDAEA